MTFIFNRMGTFIISLIEAIAAAAAAILAAMALKTSNKANDLAEKMRDDNQKFKDEEREKDDEQRRNAVAMSVYAYWAKRDDNQWGVVISNKGPRATVVKDFRVEVKCKDKDRTCHESHQMVALPVGEFFIEHKTTKYGWGNLVSINENERFKPVVYANTWRVDKISFIDHLNEQWTYTPETGYTHQPAS
ncbi:hypothetical protein HMPREF2785_00160 [Corynebacterium sp. HMSC067D03]|nr:hypothetical protein HMPREF2785_00160 [Corynebacterium sp. HMSC067D03]